MGYFDVEDGFVEITRFRTYQRLENRYVFDRLWETAKDALRRTFTRLSKSWTNGKVPLIETDDNKDRKRCQLDQKNIEGMQSAWG
jgi:hypothetical protein